MFEVVLINDVTGNHDRHYILAQDEMEAQVKVRREMEITYPWYVLQILPVPNSDTSSLPF